MTRLEMQHGGPGVTKLQFVPSSGLLNRPISVVANTVAGFCGSIARDVAIPMSGPSRVQTFWPAHALSAHARMVMPSNTVRICSYLIFIVCQAEQGEQRLAGRRRYVLL